MAISVNKKKRKTKHKSDMSIVQIKFLAEKVNVCNKADIPDLFPIKLSILVHEQDKVMFWAKQVIINKATRKQQVVTLE